MLLGLPRLQGLVRSDPSWCWLCGRPLWGRLPVVGGRGHTCTVCTRGGACTVLLGLCHLWPCLSLSTWLGPPLCGACTLTGSEPATPRTRAKGRQQALSLA